jgi:aryl-alcohol dehydrogenase-like predicted oxidoreductase
MRTITLPATDLQVSKLSFGTASLHHLFTDKERNTLLASAVDAGFTHFDTSPYYGFGIGEAAIGALPADLRNRITIAGKVGLYSPQGATAHIASVVARKIAGKFLKQLNTPVVDWQVATAQQSLDNTLRRLHRDHLDILFLHEPESALIHTEEWQTWLASRVKAGQIRHWGIAGEAARIDTMLANNPSLAQIVQVRDSLTLRQADAVKVQRPLQFTYGYLAGNSANVPTAELLQRACDRNATGSILVSTRQVQRVSELARAVG